MSENVQTPELLAPPTRAEIMHAIEIATDGFRHNEVIVQSRLQNFLVADTILLSAWATLFSENNIKERAIVLFVLAALSTVLSIAWAILGMRQRKFLNVQMHIICNLEKNLPKILQVNRDVKDLQDGKEIAVTRCKKIQSGCRERFVYEEKKVKLTAPEFHLKSRNLLVGAPIAFAVASLLLIVVLVVSLWLLPPGEVTTLGCPTCVYASNAGRG